MDIRSWPSISRILSLALIVCIGIVLFHLLYLQPFFGYMDDAELIQQSIQTRTLGFWPEFWPLMRADYRWGMIRPLYPFMVATLYGNAGDQPSVLFLLNFVFALFAIIASAYAWTRAFAPKLLSAPSQEQSRIVFLVTILFSMAWPWTHDLFLHPSLQEKLVMTAGAANLLWFSKAHEKLKHPWYFLATTLILLLGFGSKVQFAYFMPTLLVLMLDHWSQNKLQWYKIAYVIALFLIWLGATKLIAAQGIYTAHFNYDNSWIDLWSGKPLLLLTIGLIWLAYVFSKFARFPLIVRLLAGAPAWSLLFYIGIMLPRGIGGYLLSPLGAILGFMLGFWMLQGRDFIKYGAVALLSLAAMSLSFYRSSVFFGKLADVRTLLYSQELVDIAQKGGHITMCLEGASNLSYYARRYRGIDLSASSALAEDPSKQYFIADSKLCVIDQPKTEVLWTSPHRHGIIIFR